ncbi:MAG: DEAD/DEAH box helicase family protein [Hydrogenobacter sp.]
MNLEKYLILNKYLLSLFGVNENGELFGRLKGVEEGYDSDGRSYYVNVLKGLTGKLPEEKLYIYDENIKTYVNQISRIRGQISLKYFQYLAVLFTEIVLDNLKNNKDIFLNELNGFIEKNYKNQNIIDKFTEDDLRKLAFWMATGAGKTLIMHINYYQFFNYDLFTPDNIILITPNEVLSGQHFEELKKSGIPCKLYSNNSRSISSNGKNGILIIEITKFVEEKKGSGMSIPVSTFEGKTLVFVDEAHKGRKAEDQKWAKIRDELAKEGFTFEYSATFGQILSEKNPETLRRYAKSIVFDYSYKYFYLDGYGKDFFIMNVKPGAMSDEKFQELMFTANLLSFYEQLLAYEEKKDLAKQYNIEKPLWIFVGATVIGKNGNKGKLTKEEKETISDVIKILEFIKKAIENEEWLKRMAEDILSGSLKINENGNQKDIFENKFNYLKGKNIKLEDLYEKVFGGKGAFRLFELKKAEGEIGLKVGENPYFGVINIGNVSEFKKLLEAKGISIEQDVISNSLFNDINKENSSINILIGSKKFIEGWDTWRVSSMGLLNIGRGQGPQIIQLFGRGVRLKGQNMSLKRSGNEDIKVLETLNIYGIKADYLNKFLEAIRREDVDFENIEIPVKPMHEDKWKELYILSKSEKKFEEEKFLKLEIDNTINYTIDLTPKVSIYQSEKEEIQTEKTKIKAEGSKFTEEIVSLLNWEEIFSEMVRFKMQRNYWNLVFDMNILKDILISSQYNILLPNNENVENIEKLEDIALLVIKKYIDLFYKKKAKRFETEHLTYKQLDSLPIPSISSGKYGYAVKIEKTKQKLIEEIRELIKDFEKLLKENSEILPHIYFDRSLYVPLLLQSKEIDEMKPQGLVESERKFIEGLREYINENKQKFSGLEIYLLRNVPFSGVGFQLQWSGFYPDFIVWVKDNKKQIIVFIDPKGLEHMKELDNEKIRFSKEIKEIENELKQRGIIDKEIILESFILSNTPYQDLIKGRSNPPTKEDYKNCHVLFLEDKNWAEDLFNYLLHLEQGEGKPCLQEK